MEILISFLNDDGSWTEPFKYNQEIIVTDSSIVLTCK